MRGERRKILSFATDSREIYLREMWFEHTTKRTMSSTEVENYWNEENIPRNEKEEDGGNQKDNKEYVCMAEIT